MKFKLDILITEDPEPGEFNVKVVSIDKIETDNFIKLASQLQFVLVNIGEKLKQRELSRIYQKDWNPDDIPF